METLASVWACDPRDLGEERQEPPSVWGSQYVTVPPVGLMWTQQASPHLQRNKQLQDTLLQREEELARLQEENNKLREFLNSSFVRKLEQKAKKLSADDRRKLKRNLMCVDDGPFQSCSHQLQTPQQVSKRVCRNLTAEFCSESADTSPPPEPNLDLWVLRTLGLKDRDTIDTSSDSSSSPGFGLCSLVYDAEVTSSSSSEYSLTSSLSPPVALSYHQTSARQPGGYSAAERQQENCVDPAKSAGPGSDFTAAGLTGAFTEPPDRAEICPITASSRHPAKHPAYWSPLSGGRTPPQDKIQHSPPGERVPFSPDLASSPFMNHLWTPVRGCSPTSPSAGSLPPAAPQTPRTRTDLAFSMSLSPSSSVKTHSFPQGQAFVRKDTEGKWNFTWVPRQGP